MERMHTIDVESGDGVSGMSPATAGHRRAHHAEQRQAPASAPALAKAKAAAGQLQQADKEEPQKEAFARNAAVSHARVMFLVGGHALCAASLLVVNKWALKRFPYVWTLATMQFVFAALVTITVGKLGLVEVSPLEPAKLVAFFPAAGMFFVTITAGNAVVGVSNVDTFIVMRSVVPIPSAMLEAAVLGEPCPPPRSWIGLATILLGAVAYSSRNQGLLMGSAAWVTLYLVLMPIDGVLIKHLVGGSGLSPWGLVLYNNVCAAMPGIVFSLLLEGDLILGPGLVRELSDPSVLLPVVISCFAGLAISYFQLNVRKVISSTAFMVLGVSNKFLSVLMNQLASLDTNKDVFSVGSVLLSIAGAILFQQTVAGKGISQAPSKRDVQSSGTASCIAVALAVSAAAYITYSQKRAEAH